jgi:Carboxypeptidase regulatory-like domain
MSHPKLIRAFFALCLCLLFIKVSAQVTTATISGTITNKEGKPLAGATVKIAYANAGISKLTTTQSNGTFVVPNLRVGGPYNVTVSYTGYQEKTEENIILELGQNSTVDVKLETSSVSLEAVTVGARSKIFDNQRTGASTNISSRQLRQMPTISRSADDFTRLTPSASSTVNGTSFAGRNGQYNNYSLDGAVFNNPFGLDAPTPGGQTNSQPVSLDAIDQIQVNIAPYDVTQAGFTGAGVNTVTKSGTNTLAGTVYGFYRNEGLTGKKVDGNKIVVPKLNQYQAGFALGGAIKKDKLFYFINFETEQRQDAPTGFVAQNAANADKSNTSRVLEQDLIDVRTILKNKFGYETGDYQGFNYKQKSNKWLAKFDWVINSNNSLSFTYNGLDASKEKPAHPSAIGRRGPDFTTLQFRNSGYRINNKLQSFGTELKSSFGSKYANKLRLVYTTFRDNRDPLSTPFPVINLTKNGVRYIIAGHEPFSINNILNQDAFQATDNFNIILPKHTITAGASYESFKFANSFNLQGYGNGIFTNNDISNFLTTAPVDGNLLLKPDFSGLQPISAAQAYAKNRAASGQWTFYYLTVSQISAYVQDEFKAGKNFKLTYGIRVDAPSYGNASYKNPTFNLDGTFTGNYQQGSPTVANNDPQVLFDANGNRVTNGVGKDLDNTRFPTKKPLLSPRLGFNWDINGNKTAVLRGGTGLFTGRFPFVWLGNQQANPGTGFYNVTDKNFQWPQIWRSNLGLDFKVKKGTIFSADIAYSKDRRAMMVRNYNLGTPTGVLNSGTGDNRKIYKPTDKGTDGPFANNTYVFTNAKNTGYQFNISLQAVQTFKNGWYIQGSYNYLIAKDASSISAEISSDAFDRNPILNNANEARNSTSLYGNKHRFVLAGIKKFEYGKDKAYATTVSFFANWVSGDRFAYVYGGDINNDGTGTNDLLYVPTDKEVDNMQFVNYTDVFGVVQGPAVQRATFKNYLATDKYLSQRRGEYTEKYAGSTPWFSQMDVRILQDFNFTNGKKKNTVQLSIDIQNFGNLLNSSWGIRKTATTSGFFQPISVAGFNGSGQPQFNFDPSTKSTFTTSPDLISRWQMQFGLRYIF